VSPMTGKGGEKRVLGRSLGSVSLTSIVVANMIGAGIFTTSGLLITQLAHPILMLALWMLGGILALFGALSYSELGATFPEAGGEYTFLSRIFSPLAGFLSGWVSFIVGFSAPVAASALAFSEYLMRAVPGTFRVDLQGLAMKAIAVGIILLFTLLHSLGMRSGAKVQNILTLVKVLLITGLLLTGFLFGAGSTEHFTMQLEGAGEGLRFQSAGWAMVLIMFSFSGWNASTYVGSEVRSPLRNIPRSLVAGTLLVTILYLLLNTLYIYALRPSEMSDVIAVGGLTANRLFNLTLDKFFSLFIAVILLSSISAYTIIGPRVYYAMSESGHFFRLARKVNRFQVPALSIMVQSLLAILFAVTGTFDQILTLLGFSLGIFPILSVMGVFRLRIRGESALPLKGYPYIQIVFILLSALILVLTFLERPAESSIALLVIAAGLPVYRLLKKFRSSCLP